MSPKALHAQLLIVRRRARQRRTFERGERQRMRLLGVE